VVSGDVLINCFQYIFYIKPNFDVSLFVKPYNYIPYGRSIYFQNSSLSKIRNEVPSLWALISFFNIFYKSIFPTTFPFYKDRRNRKNTSLVLFLSLKIMGIIPRVYNCFEISL
jgi:hypothetical protein